ncbi:MAG: DUF2846 domain-containing protein [Pseudomonadota bacterium]|nr:DUF2846 domain-containing protein [Pseudomonadota bacterium]
MRSMLARSLFCSILMLPALAMAQEATADASVDVAATAEVATLSEEVAADAAATVGAPADTASVPQAEAEAPAAEVAAPAANGLIGAAHEGHGQIVFYRPSKMAGAAIGFKVREGDVELGKLRNGRYFVANVEPGVHEYTVHSETKDVLTIEVEEGETYYVQGTLSMGILAGRPNLSPSDEASFNGMSKKLKPAN